MKVDKRNIILADCEDIEVESFKSGLQGLFGEFSIKSHIANWKRTGKLSEVKRYLKYFITPLKYFLTRGRYDIIIGWQQFYALIFCFYCSIFHVKKKNTLVCINFTYKAKKLKIYKWFMQKCINPKYLDYIHVPSYDYANLVSLEFNYPIERIIVTPFGINDNYNDMSLLPRPSEYINKNYALAIGRSNRDYDFLIAGWKDIDYPLVIISDTYTGENGGNQNIKIYKNIAGAESEPFIANCDFVVIPIDDGKICSGDTVLLTAMSLKKIVVVTKPSTLSEMYIQDGVDGLTVEKNVSNFTKLINKIITTDDYKQIGESARSSFLTLFSRESMGKSVAKAIKRSNE